MTAFITCHKVSRVFDAGGEPFHALRGVELCIDRGELVAVVGASGSGKSTLLNTIGGLDRPSEGEITIDGRRLSTLAEPELADLRNHVMGFIFQQFNLLTRYDALRNVELPLIYAGLSRADRRRRSRDLLNELGLSAHAHKRPTQMSGGQQQRVAIARALANRPQVILADEPTGALDSLTSEDVMRQLVTLNREQGMTVIIVTHDMNIANRCDRIIRFHDGRIVEDRPVPGAA